MRLIDLDKVDVEQIPCGYSDHTTLEDVKEWLDELPTITPDSLVKRGRWELHHVGHGHYWECSNCHTNPCIYVTKDTKYCPNCGAKMED